MNHAEHLARYRRPPERAFLCPVFGERKFCVLMRNHANLCGITSVDSLKMGNADCSSQDIVHPSTAKSATARNHSTMEGQITVKPA
ncbi:MAG: hypothetical protein FWF31_12395 [Desulfobulbus sp.]|nr:hypothetical protein [Desulfobulbus sp.]